jgi:hypothetical protein
MMINMDRIYGYVAAFSVGVIFMIVASMTNDDAQRSSDLYCEMVLLYDATDGEYGWPDYRNEATRCEERD